MKQLYSLDTDTLSLLQDNHPEVVRRVREHEDADVVAVSVITVEEVLNGWYSLVRRARNSAQTVTAYQSLADSVELLGAFSILPFNEVALARFEQLRKAKTNVKAMDLRIAAIALEHGAVVVTRNRRDFERVPGLGIEDWTQ